jgi:nucleoside-diphosphate-sugar epimerase
MNICITGITGFVGQNLSEYLKKNFKIRGISRSELQSQLFDKLSSCEVFIHLAGKAHDIKNSSDPNEYYDVNYELTKILFDGFLQSDVKKFIFLSSVKACSDSINHVLTEHESPSPKTDYGKSKLLAEEYILSQSLPNNKSCFILRPCMIHGPCNKGNLNLLYKLISKGIPYPLASFENERSFLSIENLCFVIRELLERDNIPSGVYNVADDETLSTNELIKLIAGATNRTPKLWKISPVWIKSIAKLGDLLKLPLTTERLNKLTESYVVDNSKIKYALGKEFPVQAREGIIKTIKSFKKAI